MESGECWSTFQLTALIFIYRRSPFRRGGGQFGLRGLERYHFTAQASAFVRHSAEDCMQLWLQADASDPRVTLAVAQIKQANEVNSPPGLNPRRDISVCTAPVNRALSHRRTWRPLEDSPLHALLDHGEVAVPDDLSDLVFLRDGGGGQVTVTVDCRQGGWRRRDRGQRSQAAVETQLSKNRRQ